MSNAIFIIYWYISHRSIKLFQYQSVKCFFEFLLAYKISNLFLLMTVVLFCEFKFVKSLFVGKETNEWTLKFLDSRMSRRYQTTKVFAQVSRKNMSSDSYLITSIILVRTRFHCLIEHSPYLLLKLMKFICTGGKSILRSANWHVWLRNIEKRGKYCRVKLAIFVTWISIRPTGKKSLPLFENVVRFFVFYTVPRKSITEPLAWSQTYFRACQSYDLKVNCAIYDV